MKSLQIYNFVERLSEILRTDTRQSIANHGLQPIQLEALHYLSLCNRFSDTPMAVTDYLGQTKGTVSQTLKVLENKDLLNKVMDKSDKRVWHMKVTDKGQKILNETIPTTMFVKACESLADKRQLEITESLQTLLRSLLQSNQMKTFGVCHTCRFNSFSETRGYYCNLVNQPLTKNETLKICKEHENQP